LRAQRNKGVDNQILRLQALACCRELILSMHGQNNFPPEGNQLPPRAGGAWAPAWRAGRREASAPEAGSPLAGRGELRRVAAISGRRRNLPLAPQVKQLEQQNSNAVGPNSPAAALGEPPCARLLAWDWACSSA
jgi:hypothetical protein